MGHERVGALPRTKRWRDVVGGIADAAAVDGDARELANATLENVRSRLLSIHGDTGFVASFQFLLGLALSASPRVDRDSLGELAVDLDANPSPLRLASALHQYVETNSQSAEYAEIARKAAVDVISAWTEQHTLQLSLQGSTSRPLRFGGEPVTAGDSVRWRACSSGSSWNATSITSLVVRPLLTWPQLRTAERLARRLGNHVDGVSHHAFETARITQSFAAGWFNRNARERMPTEDEISGFLSHSVGKLREELLRENSP